MLYIPKQPPNTVMQRDPSNIPRHYLNPTPSRPAPSRPGEPTKPPNQIKFSLKTFATCLQDLEKQNSVFRSVDQQSCKQVDFVSNVSTGNNNSLLMLLPLTAPNDCKKK
ncbi:hypothetical protein PROFUN_14750 [Planoprotostelium fungivorum]|uniref:Uncharacterized protein n=1 Tax=Planoprotostelium fungivorum TaxID=1890364 RepID=A0A2P6MXX8_9EUKA|nr:hypothetical protein PROFUN_14750 [Planoprotostelium fungivorum]